MYVSLPDGGLVYHVGAVVGILGLCVLYTPLKKEGSTTALFCR